MFKGDLVVIRTKLRFWEGPNGFTRYYYDRWDHYCENGELESYWEKFHVDPKDFKLGIKIFFDGDGLLHINKCHDPELRIFLEEKEGKITSPEPKTDYSSLNLPLEMTELLTIAESIALEIDYSIKSDVTKQYANYSCGKIFAYWYPLMSQNKFRVLLRGTAEEYNDPRVTPRPENVHNGDCKAMFYVYCSDDLKYFRLFAEMAILKAKTA